MIKKVRIRDLTEEQQKRYCDKKSGHCNGCPFCLKNFEGKDWTCASSLSHIPFSDEFLNQEVEIEVPDILTKEEKEWLRKTVEMALFKVVSIEVCIYQYKFIYVNYENKDKSKYAICFPVKDGWFKGMEEGRRYTLEELGL